MFVIKHDAGKVEELGARLDVSSVQMALGKVYIEIAGIQFNERSQVLAAAGYPRGKFFVELLFDLDELKHLATFQQLKYFHLHM